MLECSTGALEVSVGWVWVPLATVLSTWVSSGEELFTPFPGLATPSIRGAPS